MNNINTSSSLPKLQSILEEDISTLNNMLVNKPKDTPLYKLVDSLINAKRHILQLIPESFMDMGVAPTPPQRNQPATYQSGGSHKNYVKDAEQLPKIFLSIEQDQAKFIQDAMSAPGLPSGVSSKLSAIFEVYEKITKQLENATQRHQINEIVL